MQASKFISMGKNEFHCIVYNNIAVHFELDGSFLLFETSSLQPGVYNQDYVRADNEISEFYMHLVNEPANFMPEKTVKDIVWNLIGGILHGSITSLEIFDLPKLTKSVAEGLTRANEAATFYEAEDESLKFVCFGVRNELLEYFDTKGVGHFSCSVLNLYYATNFKGKVYATLFADEQLCVFVNGDRTCGGIIMGINMNAFAKYRQKNS